jgi:hypothetical protein
MYVVPPKCASSFAYKCAHDNPQFLQDINDVITENVTHGDNNTVELIMSCMNIPRLANTKFIFVFRDPVYRYRSGLWMAVAAMIPEEVLSAAHGDREFSDRLFKQGARMLDVMIDSAHRSLIPQYDFGNSHTTPTVLINLLTYLCFPDKVSFVYINDFEDHLLEVFGPEFVLEHHERTDIKVSYPGDPFMDSVENAMAHQNNLYDFKAWIEPDVIAFDYLKDNYKNISLIPAMDAAIQAVSCENAITRFKDIAYVADLASRFAPAPLKENIEAQLNNYGEIAKKISFNFKDQK